MNEKNSFMPDQRSTYLQVKDLWRYATAQKMYDAADWLVRQWPALTSTEFDNPILAEMASLEEESPWGLNV